MALFASVNLQVPKFFVSKLLKQQRSTMPETKVRLAYHEKYWMVARSLRNLAAAMDIRRHRGYAKTFFRMVFLGLQVTDSVKLTFAS